MIKTSLRKLALLAFAVGISVMSYAQMPQNLPLDPSIRTGVLENGMTYYIKENAKPEGTADFFIAHAVGSMQEDQDQHGLAHFLEHMAFNGTKHFPGKGIINYVESLGGAFGLNVNAYTSFDETVYNLKNIPLKRETVIDSCLLVLHDWSSYILLQGKEIDSERGVIHEEWRTRMGGGRRAGIEANAIIYNDSKYGKRTVIGDLEVIDNFKHERIRDLYKDWYRPDLQAVVVVGDFDVDVVEGKVKELFAKIPKRENAKERVVYPVPANKEPKIAIVTDPEAQATSVKIDIKHERMPKEARNSMAGFVVDIMTSLMTDMASDRLDELVQSENPPFSFGYSFYYNMTLATEDLVFAANTKDNGAQKAFNALYTEIERIKRHGFTVGEFERAKKNLLNAYEKASKEKDKRQHERVARAIVSHYLQNTPLPGIEKEFQMAQSILPMIPVEQFNQAVKQLITDDNLLITITGPKKDGVTYPTNEDILASIKTVKDSKIKAYVDNTVIEPLVKDAPAGSKVVSTSTDAEYGTTKWTLDNGVKVIIKSTDFKEDEILMAATSNGGTSIVATDDLVSAELATTLVEQSGLGKFDMINLKKQLTGKTVKVTPFIGNLTEGFSGSSSVKDFETMLQLVYLNFTAPRFDEGKFKSFLSRIEGYVINAANDPNNNFRDTLSVVMNGGMNPRRPVMNAETFKQVNYESAKRVFEQRFADAGDFTFVFVGNIDANKVKPLIESYLGALPNKDGEETWKDEKVRTPSKDINKTFDFKMETPKTTMRVTYASKYKYNLKNNIYLSTLSHILDLRYTTSIREESGGAYGVGVWAAKDEDPVQEFKLNVQFDTDPEKAAAMKKIVHDEIAKIIKNGPTEEDLKKTKDYFLKEFNENHKKNRFWLSIIRNKEVDGYDYIGGTEYEDIIKSMSVKSCKKMFKKLLKKSNTIEVIMNPKK